MDKNTIPEDFTVQLALVDMLPVIFFGAYTIIIGIVFKSILFTAGAVICFVSGMIKVLWKIIVATKHKNVWPMFVQMRICMPLGFVMMVVSVIINHSRIDAASLFSRVLSFPSVIAFTIGICGMIAMCIFTFALDSSKTKSNWIEQGVNGFAQLCFLVGVLFCL